jgi:hypothetical protein
MNRSLAVVVVLALSSLARAAGAADPAPARAGEAEAGIELRATPGTPFAAGDRLVARQLGLVDWYRGGKLLATLADPDGLVAPGRGHGAAADGLYLVDAEGRPVHALAADGRALFLAAGPRARVFYQRGHRRPRPDPALLMTYHDGYVMSAASTVAIFWGPDWADAGFARDKIDGIDGLLSGFGGSAYARVLDEYAAGSEGHPSASTYLGHTLDPTSPPDNALTPEEVVEEACKIADNHPDPGTVYLIYTSTHLDDLDFCAYHTWWFCHRGGAPIQAAYMPNLDSFRGCSIKDTVTRHSPGLSAIANATAHELAEAITDPRGEGWFQDDLGGEIGDKCAYTFPRRATKLANGSLWKLQTLWSNAAYLAGNGQANLERQTGCR